jgi:ABC-type transport system involved in cytochrome bd biosynthesis fused ATPase/permease subunit
VVIILRAITGYLWLLMAIILLVISGYFINNY